MKVRLRQDPDRGPVVDMEFRHLSGGTSMDMHVAARLLAGLEIALWLATHKAEHAKCVKCGLEYPGKYELTWTRDMVHCCDCNGVLEPIRQAAFEKVDDGVEP